MSEAIHKIRILDPATSKQTGTVDLWHCLKCDSFNRADTTHCVHCGEAEPPKHVQEVVNALMQQRTALTQQLAAAERFIEAVEARDYQPGEPEHWNALCAEVVDAYTDYRAKYPKEVKP